LLPRNRRVFPVGQRHFHGSLADEISRTEACDHPALSFAHGRHVDALGGRVEKVAVIFNAIHVHVRFVPF
jgi:hypothetical protein